MSKDVEERRLYVGLDESNHGRYPEFIVAVSSIMKSDAVLKTITGRERMSDEEIVRFLENEQRRYRGVRAERGQIPRNKHQLVEAGPYLVEKLLRENEKEYGRIYHLEIFLDGDIMSREIDRLHKMLLELRVRESMGICIECCPKKESGGYEYPRLLAAADSIAHALFREHSFLHRLRAEERMIKLKR
jgi:hypothetical protein